jgi:hypothetical protein
MDLITIFPSIVFETERFHPKTGKKDPYLLDRIEYRDSLIISSKILEDEKGKIPKNIREEVKRVSKRIIDSSGNAIYDFAIIYDKKLKEEILKPFVSETQQIFNYFAYVKNLDHHNPLDFIKIKFFNSTGSFISINNDDEGWADNYLYMLNQPQGYYIPMRFGKNYDQPILRTLEYLSNKEKELYKKLLTAITLFNQSCRISKFNQSSAIVLITSAFEALLQIPRNSKKDNFSFAFKLFWGFDQRIEEWAAQLYDLRNHIVHGAVIEDKKLYASTYEHYQHFNIGREIFHSALIILLDLKGVIEIGREFRIGETKNLLNKIIPNKEKAERIIKKKKIYNYIAFKKDIKLYKEFIQRLEGFTGIDYSAKNYILEIVKLIFSILKDWTDELIKEEKKKNEGSKYSIYSLERWTNIQTLLAEIGNIDWSDKGQIKISGLIRNVEEQLRQLSPIDHKKNVYSFNLSEFGSRCLGALRATY